MKHIFFLLFIFVVFGVQAQVKLTFEGDIKDVKTGEPLAYATIGVRNRIEQTTSNANGYFKLTIEKGAYTDTLEVTYIGYEKFEKVVSKLAPFEEIRLKEYATVLDEVLVLDRKFDAREIDRNMRPIRGNIYAMDAEVTNMDYNLFLSYLENYSTPDLRKKYDFDLTHYEPSVREFYKKYQTPSNKKNPKRVSGHTDFIVNFNNFPAVNISYEAAVEYCKWLTDQYNSSTLKKKRYKKVIMRLPTLDEWQITALGDSKFQSWALLDNNVEVIIAKDTMDSFKGPKKVMKVDETILYPWFKIYHMRNRPYNQFGCYLGNFKTTKDMNCISRALAYDGFTMMSPARCYFPNDLGFYDVVGNVAEMIDEKGQACGGSWNDAPEKSTIQSVKKYSGPDETVGFRVFMEVIEK